ncbi:MAG TPA: transglycosylase domain-containing protein [Candidatus Dormibacteraeota bacterium]|nr:transglycosylase domain-containing protein [Candidatus Dormibacteraeota bacterium]
MSRKVLWGPAGWLIRVFLLLAIALPSLIVTSPSYAAYAAKLPDVNEISKDVPGDTLIYAADGTTLLADLHPPGYQHFYEPLTDMGTYLPEATIAIEDRNFYNEPGVDPGGIARAALVDWKSGGTVQGASTITQQLVKLRLVGDEHSIDRKLREALLSFEVEQRYSKDQILEMYLNAAFFGNSAAGSAAASQIFFHTKTKDLDLAQASMLAGLVRGPTYYSPFIDWSRAKARQKEVLDALVRDDKVTQDQADKAYAEDISPPKHMFTPVNQVVAPGFVSYVTGQLTKKYGNEVTYGGGLRVVTTLNVQLQQMGQASISGTQHSIAYRRVQQGAMVAIDPTSGAIMVMVASANPSVNGGQYNLAVWPPRNPGSSMKIYTYTTAIASGRYTMTTPIADTPIAYLDGSTWWKPRNYDGRYHGTLQLQQCMGNSLNIPAVKVELGVGVSNVVTTARNMGAPPWTQHADGSFTNDDPLNSYGPSLTLGGYGETPLQMATGASVLAAQGILHTPFAIQSITQDGKSIYRHQDESKQVLDPRVAYIMASIMSNDRNHALIFGMGTILNIRGFNVAVKTGTSDSFADAWTVGFTPRIAVAVWMGNPDWRIKMTQGSDSFYVAVPAWHTFLAAALPALGPNVWYQPPTGLVNVRGNWYLPGTQPRR